MSSPAASLRQVLSALYGDSDSCRRVVEDAGIDIAFIDFDGAISDVWFRIFLFTNPRNLSTKLLDTIIAEEPTVAPFAGAYLKWWDESRSATVGGSDLGSDVVRAVEGLRAIEQSVDAIDGLARYRVGLGRVAERIGILRTLKALHDLLHTFANTADSPVDLRAAAETAAAATGRRRLARFIQGLLHACERAAIVATALPADNGVRDNEIYWIDKLKGVTTDLQETIAGADVDEIVSALEEVRDKLRALPSSINERIVTSARIIPLAPLADLLDLIIAQRQPDETTRAAIESARLSIVAIASLVRERVAEHDLWQEVDDKLAALLEILYTDDPGRVRKFATLWSKQAKPRLAQLSRLDPAGTWRDQVALKVVTVDDLLATEALDDRFVEAFEALCWEARQQFYRVDVRLMTECADLEPLNAPLMAVKEPANVD